MITVKTVWATCSTLCRNVGTHSQVDSTQKPVWRRKFKLCRRLPNSFKPPQRSHNLLYYSCYRGVNKNGQRLIKHVDLDKSQHLYTVDYFCSTDAPKTKDWTVEVRPRRDKQIGGNGSSLTTVCVFHMPQKHPLTLYSNRL